MTHPPGAPWFAAVAGPLSELLPLAEAGRWTSCLDELNRLAAERQLCNARAQPIRFIDAGAASDLPYEMHVWSHGEVPTRTGEGAWHDFFNALVWLNLPLSKAQLNAQQAAAIGRAGVQGRRGRLRDAATLFDENGALVVGAPGHWLAAWREHDWHSLLVAERASWGRQWRPLMFGHALLDKLRAPYKAICAHAMVLTDASLLDELPAAPDAVPSAAALGRLDAALAQQLGEDRFGQAPFLPLPVLGLPGWWPANADPQFYLDRTVFRPSPVRVTMTDSRRSS